jgi:dethiobiotin synthetase
MSKGLFVTATGTDVGKTYVCALMVKRLHEAGLRAAYYKAALSGAPDISGSDAGFVQVRSGIAQDEATLLSYLYRTPVSPHLAAQLEGRPLELDRALADYQALQRHFDYVTVEGCGGIVCPLRWDAKARVMQEHLIRRLGLATLIVADAGLGAINAAVLTAHYLRDRGLGVKGLILNRFSGGLMQLDNIRMIQVLTGLKVLALVKPGDRELRIDAASLAALYEQ